MCDKNQCVCKWACRTFGKGWLPSAAGRGTYTYIYPPLGKNGASTAWYLICVHLYIVLVQTRTGEYVYIYTHIYIAFRKPIDSLTAPTPPTNVSSKCFRASGLRWQPTACCSHQSV